MPNNVTTKENVIEVLKNFIGQLEDPNTGLVDDVLVGEVDDIMERLRCDDAFGTEGQCDPRGDQRD